MNGDLQESLLESSTYKGKSVELSTLEGSTLYKCPEEALQDVIKDIKRKDLTVKGHSEGVTCSAITPNEHYLITGSSDKTIIFWELKSLSEQFVLNGHSKSVNSIDVSSDNQLLLSGSSDGYLKIWEINKRTVIHSFRDEEPIFCVCFNPDSSLSASGSADGTLKIWSSRGKKEMFTLFGHTSQVTCAKFLMVGNILISGSYDCTVKVWDIKERKILNTLSGHTGPINSIALSSNGHYIASASADKFIKIWKTSSEKEEANLNLHGEPVKCVAFSNSGKFIVSSSADTIKVWNLSQRKEKVLYGHNSIVTSLKFFNEDRCIISTSTDKTVKLWALDETREEITIRLHQGPVSAVAYSPDSKTIATGSSDCSIIVWNLRRKKNEAVFQGHSHLISCLKYTNNSSHLISASFDCFIKIWCLESKKLEFTLSGHNDQIRAIDLSSDNKFLASGSNDHSIRIWNLEKRQLDNSLPGHMNPITAISFLSGSKRLLSASTESIKLWTLASMSSETPFEIGNDKINCILCTDIFISLGLASGRIQVWDTNLSFFSSISGHNSEILSLAFLSSKKFIASSSSDCTIKIWNLSDYSLIYSLHGHSRAVQSIAFSPDNTYLISGSADFSVKFWPVADRKEEFHLTGHKSHISCIDYSPDLKFIVTGSKDGDIKVWALDRKKAKSNAIGHTGKVNWVNYSKNGNYILSCGEDRCIKVWNVEKMNEESCFQSYEPIQKALFHPSEKYIASLTTDFALKFWNLDDKKEVATEQPRIGKIKNFLFDKTGIFIILAEEKEVKIIKETDKSQVMAIKFEQKFSGKMLLSPSSRFLAVLDENYIKVFKFLKDKEEFKMMCKELECFCFSNCEVYIIIGKSTGTVGVINLNERRKEYKITAHKGPCKCIVAMPNGMIVTGGEDCFVKFFKLLKRESIGINDNYQRFLPLTKSSPGEDQDMISNPGYQPLLEYLGVIYKIKNELYQNIILKNMKMIVSKNGFSILHIIAYLGLNDTLEAISDAHLITFVSDSFGHSPLYYSIKSNHHRTSQLLTKFLIYSSQNKKIFHQNLHAIRNDFLMIFSSCPKEMHSLFLSLLIESSPVNLGCSLKKSSIKVAFSKTWEKSIYKFATNSKLSIYEEIVFYAPLLIPCICNSSQGLMFIETIANYPNKSIFSTKFIASYLQYAWQDVKALIYFHSLLIWLCMIFLFLYFNTNNAFFLVLLFVANIFLSFWEIMHMFAIGLHYFRNLWNVCECFRLFSLFIWLLLGFFFDELMLAKYFVCFFSAIQGFKAFRLCPSTRYYKNLIFFSLEKIKYFFIMLIFSVLAFGLLFLPCSSINQEFASVWIRPFGIISGRADDDYEDYNSLQYLTQFLIFMLIILLLSNLIIPLLVEVLEQFNEKAERYQNKDLAFIIYEAANIKSLFLSDGKSKYMITLERKKGKAEETKNIKGFEGCMMRKIESSEKVKSQNVTLVDKDNELVKKIQNLELRFNGRIKKVEESIVNLSEKIDQILSCVRTNS